VRGDGTLHWNLGPCISGEIMPHFAAAGWISGASGLSITVGDGVLMEYCYFVFFVLLSL
jgi:hypothetical protein